MTFQNLGHGHPYLGTTTQLGAIVLNPGWLTCLAGSRSNHFSLQQRWYKASFKALCYFSCLLLLFCNYSYKPIGKLLVVNASAALRSSIEFSSLTDDGTHNIFKRSSAEAMDWIVSAWHGRIKRDKTGLTQS